MLFYTLWSFIATDTDAFTTPPRVGKLSTTVPVLFGEGGNGARRGVEEKRMEQSSMTGAKAAAKMSLEERTKRVILAEAVEDRIFEIADDLEALFDKNNGILGEEDTEEATELAKQTKALQIQYDDLVSGKPSLILDADRNNFE